jgi:hypothetical protein
MFKFSILIIGVTIRGEYKLKNFGNMNEAMSKYSMLNRVTEMVFIL